jgi:hypothetical protein
MIHRLRARHREPLPAQPGHAALAGDDPRWPSGARRCPGNRRPGACGRRGVLALFLGLGAVALLVGAVGVANIMDHLGA